MIGGDEDAVKRCWPAFEAMAKYIFYVGGIGKGQAYKLVNNMAVFNLGTVTRECLNLGLKAGLDLQMMIDVMSVSTGGSWGLTNMGHMLKSGRRMPRPPAPPPGQAPPPLGNKDIDLALEMAKAVGANIPVAKFMKKLDTASVYDAIAAAMRR
jgi:3-hydroxyisobutyrate dehydrogenase-like beta-hydroxyacid dehydrogenase